MEDQPMQGPKHVLTIRNYRLSKYHWGQWEWMNTRKGRGCGGPNPITTFFRLLKWQNEKIEPDG